MLRGGVLLIHKRPGMASFDVIRQLRRNLKTKKLGFLGTLDPFAEGILPVFVNHATRLIPYLDESRKVYRVLIAFGHQTTTGDGTGEIVEEMPLTELDPTELTHRINEAINVLQARKEQRIPAYSAAKYKGKKLYEYARAGEAVPELYKAITVYELKLLHLLTAKELADSYGLAFSSLAQHPLCPRPEPWEAWTGRGLRGGALDRPNIEAQDSAFALLHCEVSGGTYIRQLVEDLGKIIGYPAYALRLIRTQTGAMKDEHAMDVDEVLFHMTKPRIKQEVSWYECFWPRALEGAALLHPLSACPEIPVLECSHEIAMELLQGKRPLAAKSLSVGRYALVSPLGFLGLVQNRGSDQRLRVERMLVPLEDYRAKLS